MAYYMTSQNLIDSVKRRANIPDSQSMVDDSEILDYANEELALNLIPLVLSKHEDYFLIREEVSVVDGTLSYQIPYRALGNKLKQVAYIASDGRLIELTRVSLDQITDYRSGCGERYHIEDENIVIDSSSTNLNYDTIAFFYNIRPNELVDSDRVSVITSIDRNVGIITVSTLPENFDSSTSIDFIKTKSPHRIIDYDITPTVIDTSNKYFTFDVDDIPSQLVVGDRICVASETDLINIPSELHVMLAEMVAARVLESIGDLENLSAVNKKIQKMESNAQYLLDNRVTDSPLKANHKKSLLRSNRYRRYNR